MIIMETLACVVLYVMVCLTSWVTRMPVTHACLPSILHRQQVQHYMNVTRIHLNQSSGLYNCLEACDNDEDCSSVIVEKVSTDQGGGVNCYIQNGGGNVTLESGSGVKVLQKRERVGEEDRAGAVGGGGAARGRATREACLPCAKISEHVGTQPVPQSGLDSLGPPSANRESSNITHSDSNATYTGQGRGQGSMSSNNGTDPVTISNSSNSVNANHSDTNSNTNSSTNQNPASPHSTGNGSDPGLDFLFNLTSGSDDSCRAPFRNLSILSGAGGVNGSGDSGEVGGGGGGGGGGRGGCYFIPEDFQDAKKTFEDAEDACQSLHPRSHLIHTETKQVSTR